MKKLNKLKINEIAKDNLSHKEMRHVVGGTGGSCRCSCYWEGQGGSSVEDNCKANREIGDEGHSIYGYTQMICIDDVIINP